MAEKNKGEESEAQTVVAEATPTPKKKFDFKSLNTLAVVSLAAGISGVGALIAVITGHISLAQLRDSGEKGKALAATGTVLGYLHLVGWIIFTILAVVSSALFYSGFMGLQPGGPEFFEFRRGFDGMHMRHDG
jgi:peptidyl-prolyl cis-trans isomerase B (cyclophilin B)